MASAAVNSVGTTPDAFLECCGATPAAAGCSTTYGWLSPRISFSFDFVEDDKEKPQIAELSPSSVAMARADPSSLGKVTFVDFEFQPDDPISMLPADELISDGKLLPLHLAPTRPQADPVEEENEITSTEPPEKASEVESTATAAAPDPTLLSPKAPRCTARWRELLRRRKAAQSSKAAPLPKTTESSTSSSGPSRNLNPRNLRRFLQRNPKSAEADSSLSLPLLRDSDAAEPESTSLPSRPSRSSSSSSGLDLDDLPRLSLDSDKPNLPKPRPSKPRVPRDPTKPLPDHPPVRLGRSSSRRAVDAPIPPRGVSVDSPRMNPSGKVVFQSLERSSSSPGSFNGGPRLKHRPIERSYSANVRVAPVLNVFGFAPLFSSTKKEPSGRIRGRSSGGKSEKA